MIRWFDEVYNWLNSFIEAVSDIGCIVIAMICMILTIITIPVWIVPYLIYRKKRNENGNNKRRSN